MTVWWLELFTVQPKRSFLNKAAHIHKFDSKLKLPGWKLVHKIKQRPFVWKRKNLLVHLDGYEAGPEIFRDENQP